jgi:uncharacterized protein YneF (UPF0154 family)
MVWDIIIPIVTFILGAAVGAVAISLFIKKKLGGAMNGQMDDKQITNIAKSMGVNLNQKQLNMINKKMSQQKGKDKPKKK